MDVLYLTEGDTKPIRANLAINLTGYTIKLLVASNPALVKVATITDAAAGAFEFARAANDFVLGRYTAALLIIEPGGVEECSDQFVIKVDGRPA